MKEISFFSRTLAVLLLPTAGLAATLPTVPMQGDMVMPTLAYHAIDGTLTVQMDPTLIPQLTPLLVSNPADSLARWRLCDTSLMLPRAPGNELFGLRFSVVSWNDEHELNQEQRPGAAGGGPAF